MLTNEELKAALSDVLSIKRAMRQSQLNETWIHLRALELRLGRGLRAESHTEGTDAV
jgi:hypothetical protein